MSENVMSVRNPFGMDPGDPRTAYLKVNRKDWEFIEAVMKAARGIPHTEINPLTSGLHSKERALKALDAIVDLWKEFYPQEAKLWWGNKARGTSKSLKDPEFGTTETRASRFLVSAPVGLVTVIRRVFPGQKVTDEEGRKFWRMMAKRYPELRMPEKV